MIDMDKEGTERVIQSLITECNRGTRYTQKKCPIRDHIMEGFGSKAFWRDPVENNMRSLRN